MELSGAVGSGVARSTLASTDENVAAGSGPRLHSCRALQHARARPTTCCGLLSMLAVACRPATLAVSPCPTSRRVWPPPAFRCNHRSRCDAPPRRDEQNELHVSWFMEACLHEATTHRKRSQDVSGGQWSAAPETVAVHRTHTDWAFRAAEILLMMALLLGDVCFLFSAVQDGRPGHSGST
jgi:hypothetical protein